MMLTGKDALVFFYGIFWATTLSVIGRYHLFSTHHFFSRSKRNRAIFRFLMAFIIMNIAPILWLWILYMWIVPGISGVLPIISAAFASLSVFGFQRILHAVIATENFYSKFYYDEEWETIITQWKGSYPNTFLPHFLPGVGYLVVFSLIAYGVGHL